MTATLQEPVLEQDAELARRSSQSLAPFVQLNSALSLRVMSTDHEGPVVTLSPRMLKMIQQLLSELAAGHAVSILASHEELTTQQAAEVLNVSKPFVIKLLDEGKMPSRKVGTHRRVLLEDVLRYKQSMRSRQMKALDELAAEAQELGMGY
jgi:excisionase family DNA binding protein